MAAMMTAHLDEQRVNRVLFELLSESVSDDDFSVAGVLSNAGENLPTVQAFFDEFHLYIMVGVNRPFVEGCCRGGLNCLRLRIHSILNVICRRAHTDSYATANTISCPRGHTDNHINCAYQRANSLLTHPFFTPKLCGRIIRNIAKAVHNFNPPRKVVSLVPGRDNCLYQIEVPAFHLLPERRQREETSPDPSPVPSFETSQATTECHQKPREASEQTPIAELMASRSPASTCGNPDHPG